MWRSAGRYVVDYRIDRLARSLVSHKVPGRGDLFVGLPFVGTMMPIWSHGTRARGTVDGKWNMTNYPLSAAGGSYVLTGGDSHAFLRAPYTGRRIDVEASSFALAEKWRDACTESARVHANFEEAFETELQSAVGVPFAQPLFRGRRDFKLKSQPDSFEFGPNENPGRGRYNWNGICTLYLSDSKVGVMLELGAAEPGCELWTQEYSLPSSLKLLDGRGLSCRSFMAGVFWVIERERDPVKGSSCLGARIAELVGLKFNGMIVPGVRGTDGNYLNVVVFEPVPGWKTWVTACRAPRPAG